MPRARLRSLPVLAMAALLACLSPVRADLETEIEEGLGRWMAQAFIAQRGRLEQPPIEQWVSDLGRHLARHSPRRDLDYHFVVLDSPEINGFALPGGWVFVTAGLLETMQSEDELAAVMAHELAHLAERDFQHIVLRSAIFFGIAHLLRDNERGDWVPVLQAVQVVDALRDSRRREAQADSTGAGIAWRAGYDPRAMATFLGDEQQWSYLQTVFATHPHPNKRERWIDERFDALSADDPAGVNALAASLMDRGRYGPAVQLLQRPLPDGDAAERLALLDRAEAARSSPAAAASASGLSEAAVTALESGVKAMSEAREESQDTRSLAWKRLRRMWDDAQIERGLTYAQALDPELTDPAYLALLAQTVNLMHRAMRGANLLGRTLHMASSNVRGLKALGGSLAELRTTPEQLHVLETASAEVGVAGRRIASRSAADASDLARLANDYHESGRLVTPLLVELALAGEGDPGGRLVFSRFMVLQTQVRLLESRISDLDERLETLAASQWRDAILVRRLQLDALGVEAAALDVLRLSETVAARINAKPERVATHWRESHALGDVVLALLRDEVVPGDEGFGSHLRGLQIMMRIIFIESKEQVTWATK